MPDTGPSERCACGAPERHWPKNEGYGDTCAFMDTGYPWCRVCGENHRPPECAIDHDVPSTKGPSQPSCPTCGDTPMFRSVVHACCEKVVEYERLLDEVREWFTSAWPLAEHRPTDVTALLNQMPKGS